MSTTEKVIKAIGSPEPYDKSYTQELEIWTDEQTPMFIAALYHPSKNSSKIMKGIDAGGTGYTYKIMNI